ncbi:MAG: GIY-YIG nuclease family protein [Sphingopyxis sp.]|nr:GIY-YIG nuclease family protein [Sphingopyxis sp.]
MANHRRGQTYLGSTSNLSQRVWQHRSRIVEGHSKAKGCTILVWCEYFSDLQEARACEYRMKKWKREWKIRLIEERNPEWRDLFDELNW